MNELNIASILIGAAAFALLWSIEPLIPAFKPDSERRLGRPVRDDSRTLTDPALFSDRIHLNDRGAEALADTLVGAGFVGRSDR